MSYSEACKLHDIKRLRGGSDPVGPEEVLRTIFVIVLDPETAAWCLGLHASGAVTRWPSTLYRVLARAALESPSVWNRCRRVLDRRLQTSVSAYTAHCPADLVEVFVDGRDSMDGNELAGLLWCLVRQRCSSHDLVAQRLSTELEVVAARRLRGIP